jgi:hypothetical protein
VHLVGCIIRIYYDAQTCERQTLCATLLEENKISFGNIKRYLIWLKYIPLLVCRFHVVPLAVLLLLLERKIML